MRYIILFLLIFLCTLSPSFGINWQDVTALNGKSGMLDIDSIKEYNGYYFYNIKVFNKHENEFVILTMQSRKHGSLGARIKYYTPEEYENLKGDYDNITKNMTTKLETVEYGSVASACYLTVNSIVNSRQINIQF